MKKNHFAASLRDAFGRVPAELAQKLLKQFVLASTFICLMGLVSSCKDDILQENSSIIGTWEYSETNMEPNSKNDIYRITFFEDGTYGDFMVRYGTNNSGYTDSNTWILHPWELELTQPQHWEVRDDTLGFPDAIYQGRQIDYTYRFSSDKKSFYLKRIHYPHPAACDTCIFKDGPYVIPYGIIATEFGFKRVEG